MTVHHRGGQAETAPAAAAKPEGRWMWLLVPWAVGLYGFSLASGAGQSPPGPVLGHLGAVVALIIAVGGPGHVLGRVQSRYGRRHAQALLAAMVGFSGLALVLAAGALAGAAAAVLMLGAAYGYGAVIVRWLDLEGDGEGWQGLPGILTMGLIALMVVGIVAGSLRLLTLTAVAAVCLVGVALAVRSTVGGGRTPTGRPPSAQGLPAISWWWGWGLLVLIGLTGAVAPEVRHDALVSHLPIAREFATSHAVVEMRQQIQSYWPLNAQVLYAMGMVLVPGESVPKLLHYSAGVVAGGMTYSLGARIWNGWVGLAGAMIVAGTPLVLWVGGTAYTDLWVVLLGIGMVTGLHVLTRRPTVRRAAVIGLIAGAAVGAKLPSLFIVVPVALTLLLLAARATASLTRRLGMLAAFALAAALTGTYWYARAWVLSGNPLLPFLNDIFKSPYWAAEGTRLNMPIFGMGSTLGDLASLPWRLTFFPYRFVEEGALGIAYLALLPALLPALWRGVIPRWLGGVAGAALLLWFLVAQYLRYLLPVVPIFALMGAASVLGGPRAAGASQPARAVLALSVVAAAASWIGAGGPYFPLDALGGAARRPAYASRHVVGYPVAEYARRALPTSARIYGAGEDYAFYYERTLVPISWYGRPFSATLSDEVLAARSGQVLQAMLTQEGFTHLVVGREHEVVRQWRHADGWLAREAFWEEGPRLLFAYREHFLFALDASGHLRPPGRGPELLRNPGMLIESTPAPSGWAGHGPLHTVRSVRDDGTPDARVRVGPGGHINQRVPAGPNRLYVLEAELRSLGAPGSARLLIEWLDADGRVLDYTTWRRVSPRPEAGRYAMACASLPRAASARVWVVVEPGDAVEVSRVHFYELR